MFSKSTPRRARVGTMTHRQLQTLVAVLAPYRGEPVTAPVIELATRLAKLESREVAQ